ncbi:MAG: Dolichyl-phosphate beta-D-mannosyltransferase [Marmoricola sp.]|nr:Dolichyl-phosphate beta-D-mannosyltransferase [Marmoricola sp.]
MTRTLVVVPTYDEIENIETAIARVQAASPGTHVLVVDDNSPDGTGDRVAHHRDLGTTVHLLRRPGKAGLGAAYRAGFAWALDHGYDVVVQMDADLSHPPERVPALVAALEHADMSIGSRYCRGGGVENWSWSRRLISWLGNVYVRLVLGLPVRDATAGFKAYRAEALAEIGAVTSHSNGYCFQIENTWQATRRGLRVVEVPITFTDRALGQSKMSGAIVVEAVVRVLGWRLRPRAHGFEPVVRQRVTTH